MINDLNGSLGSVKRRKWSPTANDPQTGNDPQIGPQMIPGLDRKWSSRKMWMTWSLVSRIFFLFSFYFQERMSPKTASNHKDVAHAWKIDFLIFRLEIPHDELINVVCLFCSDLFSFSKKIGKILHHANRYKMVHIKEPSINTRTSLLKSAKPSSLFFFLANYLSRKPGVFIKILIHSACLKTTNISRFQNLILEHFFKTHLPYAV